MNGEPLVAWRATTPCLLIVPRIGHEKVWAGVQGDVTSAYLVASYDKIATTTEIISQTMPSQDIDTSDTILSLEGLTGTTVSIYDSIAKKSTSLGPPPGLGYDLAHPVNDSALLLAFPEFEKPEAWIWNRSTHAAEPLIQPSPEVILNIRSDGATLVWIQAPQKGAADVFFPPGNLWTSPFATSKVSITPVKRRAVGMLGEVSSAAGEGFYAMYGSTPDRKIHVFRASDARHWEFVPDLGVSTIRKVTYVDTHSVWYWTLTGIYRQAIDALGPGDPPP